jgi:RND family efflux transporter MFP subunit
VQAATQGALGARRAASKNLSEDVMSVSRQMLLLALLLPLAGCSGQASPGPEVKAVRTVTADPKPLEDDRRAVGEVRPRYESELAFLVSGKVIQRNVDVGATVRKGDLLARLDDQDDRNRLKQAEADFVAADAVLVEAKAAEERQRKLLDSGITTRAVYDTALKNFRSAQAKHDQAKSAVDLAKDQHAYSELHAEFDGIVTAIGVEAGQVVSSGKMVVRVARSEDKDAVFSVAESAFESKRPDTPPEIAVLLLSNPGVTADGVVREISPVADPTTRTFQVKVTLTNPPEQMRFGGSVVGRLKTSSQPVVVLPGSALFDKGGKPAVWVVDPVSHAVGLKPVTVARYETDRVVVSEGLMRGDVVVTAGVNRLRENQKVKIAQESAL